MIEKSVTASAARRFLVRYHGLYGERWSGASGVQAVFSRLHSVQYDPLDVVTRNADLVLQARVKNYRPALLYEQLYEKRALIDGWDKMMCIYEAADFHRFAMLREEMERETRGILRWRDQTEALLHLDEVRAHLAAHGPCSSADIPLGSMTRGRWGQARVSGAALDYLFHTGEVLVSGKKGTVKSYDFAEKLLPEQARRTETGFSDTEEFLRWYVMRRIEGLGLIWNKNGGGWLGSFLEQKDNRTPALAWLLEHERIARIRVEGLAAPLYCPAGSVSLFDGGPLPNRVRILAPLDNLLWDRGLVRALFGFSYSWEVYVPQNKRVYGYYVLPLLCGERFMGRFEPDPYRAGGTFSVRQLWIEDGFAMTGAKKAALDTAFSEFSAYLARS